MDVIVWAESEGGTYRDTGDTVSSRCRPLLQYISRTIGSANPPTSGDAREPRPVHDRRRILPRLPGCPLDDRCTGRLDVRDDVGRGVDLGNRADQKVPGAGYFVSSASSWLVAHGKLSAELAVKAAPTCGA